LKTNGKKSNPGKFMETSWLQGLQVDIIRLSWLFMGYPLKGLEELIVNAGAK
jgi:hypothetical protein